jgi:hypothetical protein
MSISLLYLADEYRASKTKWLNPLILDSSFRSSGWNFGIDVGLREMKFIHAADLHLDSLLSVMTMFSIRLVARSEAFLNAMPPTNLYSGKDQNLNERAGI